MTSMKLNLWLTEFKLYLVVTEDQTRVDILHLHRKCCNLFIPHKLSKRISACRIHVCTTLTRLTSDAHWKQQQKALQRTTREEYLCMNIDISISKLTWFDKIIWSPRKCSTVTSPEMCGYILRLMHEHNTHIKAYNTRRQTIWMSTCPNLPAYHEFIK